MPRWSTTRKGRAHRLLVYMPANQSRKNNGVTKATDRKELRDALKCRENESL